MKFQLMDKVSKEILNIIQTEFPLDKRPFLKIADKLGITEKQVIDTINNLKDAGYIRRIGGIFNSKKLGYLSLLCAAKVPKDRVYDVASFINSYSGVTHNYERKGEYNVWFTVTASSQEKIQSFLKDIRISTGINEILELPAIEVFKIKATFPMGNS